MGPWRVEWNQLKFIFNLFLDWQPSVWMMDLSTANEFWWQLVELNKKKMTKGDGMPEGWLIRSHRCNILMNEQAFTRRNSIEEWLKISADDVAGCGGPCYRLRDLVGVVSFDDWWRLLSCRGWRDNVLSGPRQHRSMTRPLLRQSFILHFTCQFSSISYADLTPFHGASIGHWTSKQINQVTSSPLFIDSRTWEKWISPNEWNRLWLVLILAFGGLAIGYWKWNNWGRRGRGNGSEERRRQREREKNNQTKPKKNDKKEKKRKG